MGRSKEFSRHRGPARTEWFEEHVARICHVVDMKRGQSENDPWREVTPKHTQGWAILNWPIT
jgi:hypothetical protein